MKKTNALRLLEGAKIPYTCIHYTYDPEHLQLSKIAQENTLPLEQIYKTLVLKGDKTGIVVAVVAGHHQLSLKKLSKASGNKKMALLPIPSLQQHTGYVRGGCSPLGMKKDYPVFIDQTAQALELMYVNAGKRGLLFGCSPNALCELSKGAFAAIHQD